MPLIGFNLIFHVSPTYSAEVFYKFLYVTTTISCPKWSLYACNPLGPTYACKSLRDFQKKMPNALAAKSE